MKRREFLATGSLLAAPLALGATPPPTTEVARQLIELRTYEIKFGGSGTRVLTDYLRDVYTPAVERAGGAVPLLLKEMSDEQPNKIWVVTTYPTATSYLAGQQLPEDPLYRQAARAYDAIPAAKPVYSRFAVQLLHAFSGMPQLVVPGPDASVFELRTYEGHSEDAVRRKTAMFNDEELPLFDEVGLHSVFFGKMIAGPYRPCLVYLLHFKDMEERNANWGAFSRHPEWKRMRADEKYADSVSNIRRTFLTPL